MVRVGISKVERLMNLVIALLSTRTYIPAERIRRVVADRSRSARCRRKASMASRAGVLASGADMPATLLLTQDNSKKGTRNGAPCRVVDLPGRCGFRGVVSCGISASCCYQLRCWVGELRGGAWPVMVDR